MNWGSFAGGLTEGLERGQTQRLRKQIEQANEYRLDDAMDTVEGRRQQEDSYLKSRGRSAVSRRSNALGEPMLYKFINFAKGKMGFGQQEQALSTDPEATPDPTASFMVNDTYAQPEGEGFGMAGTMSDGGRVKANPSYGTREVNINGRRMAVSADPDVEARALAAMKRLDDQAAADSARRSAGKSVSDEEFRKATNEKRTPEQFAKTYADGSPGAAKLTEDERVKRDAKRYQEQTKYRPPEADAPETRQAPAREAISSSGSGSKVRKALNSKAGKGAGILAAGSALLENADTPTEDYATRFGVDPESELGHLGLRTLGFASDLGNTMTFGLAEKAVPAITGRPWRASQAEQASPATALSPESAPAPAPAAPAAPEPRRAIGPTAAPAAPAQPQQPASPIPTRVIDMANVKWDPNELPGMGVKDWEDFRTDYVAGAIKQGKSAVEANNDVTTMQRDHFFRYGEQAMQLLQAGNTQGAARAMRMAYQYFPNGSDVKFGSQGDQLIAAPFDEKTNKPAGTPMPVSAERLGAMLANMKDPKAWNVWTADWHKQALEERKHREVDVPKTQAEVDTMYANATSNRMNARANQTRAEADMVTAQTPSAANISSSNKDMRAAARVFSERLQMEYDMDLATADQLASIMSQARAKNPDATKLTDDEIIRYVMAKHREQTGQLK